MAELRTALARVGGNRPPPENLAATEVPLVPIQERYAELRADEDRVRTLLGRGADKAREVSAPTLEKMYERMGFVRP